MHNWDKVKNTTMILVLLVHIFIPVLYTRSQVVYILLPVPGLSLCLSTGPLPKNFVADAVYMSNPI